MLAATGPIAVDKPALIEKEPLRRPWNDGLGDQSVGLPFPGPRVIQAQRPARSSIRTAKDVWRLLPVTSWVETDHRIENLDDNPRFINDSTADAQLRVIGDTDFVGSGKGPQRPSPNPNKIERTGLSEIRK
jgi:hypothetical protein